MYKKKNRTSCFSFLSNIIVFYDVLDTMKQLLLWQLLNNLKRKKKVEQLCFKSVCRNKNGYRNSQGNYRPVSILPVVSKILERVVYNQVCSYLSENDLIYKLQSGFRSHYSTDSALTYLSDQIRFNMNKDLYTGMVRLDIQKAFNTVDYEMLLSIT